MLTANQAADLKDQDAEEEYNLDGKIFVCLPPN